MFGWLDAPAADPGDRRRFVLDACADCGHGLLREPPPGTAAELHSSGGYASARPRLSSAAGPILRLYDRAKLRLLRRRLAPGASVLEVGAGRGRFLVHLEKAGYVARGIEPAEARVTEARSAGASIEEASVETAKVPAESLDTVVAWHVLEHTHDPGDALARIGAWLKPGGALLIGVPTARAGRRRSGVSTGFTSTSPATSTTSRPPR